MSLDFSPQLPGVRIVIETVKHGDQRYSTVGDWEFNDDGTLHIWVSRLHDWRYEALVGLHEAIEALLCKERRVGQREVDCFDIHFTGTGEPGDDPHCPYKTEHFEATTIERIVARALAVDWNEYEKAIDELGGQQQ